MVTLDWIDQSPMMLLSKFSRASEPVDLISPYQGISLSQSVLIETLGDRQVEIHVDRHPNWVRNDQIVFLTHVSFTRPIYGQVSKVDWNKSLLTIYGFNQSDHCWQARRCERVQPGEPARVQMIAARFKAGGEMADISATGMGIVVYNPQNRRADIETGTDVTLKCVLPSTHLPLKLKGKIVRKATQNNPHFTRYGILILPTAKQTRILHEYIQRRKENILHELEMVTRKAFEPMETKDLYF